MTYKVEWTDTAIEDLEQIHHYLAANWSEREVIHFNERLSSLIKIISMFPSGFPISAKLPRLRKAVLTKHNSIFYEIKDSGIYIISLFDNRQTPSKLKLT